MKFFIFILAVVIGCFLVIKTEWFIQNFCTSSWAEQHLGTSGGTRLMYKLIGIGIILIAFLWLTGGLGSIILSIFGGLFGF